MKKHFLTLIFLVAIPLMGFTWQPVTRLWQNSGTGQVNTTPFPAGVNTWTPTSTANLNTSTPTFTFTFTNTPTFTVTYTNTPTGSATPTPTFTGTFTALPTNTPAIAINPAGVGFPILDTRINAEGDLALAIDSKGNIYTGGTSQCIIEYDADGNFVKDIGTCCGAGNGQFGGGDVDGLAVDSSNQIWASDDVNNRILAFNTITGQCAVTATTGLGNAIYGIAIGPSTGKVYACDYNNNKIRIFNTNGSASANWTTNVNQSPLGVAVDLTETWVYCSLPALIEKHTLAGTFVTSYTGNPTKPLSTPAGLWIDFQNNLYVADASLQMVQKLTSNGAFITQWGPNNQVVGNFSFPEFVVGDSSGGIYVSDPQKNSIFKFNNTGYPLAHSVGKY